MFGPSLHHITAVVRRLDHSAGLALSRPRILVESRTPMNLAVLAPVWRVLLADERFSVRFTGPDRADLSEAFSEAGVKASALPRSACRRRRWDLYMNADPWDPVTLWRCRHRVNFFHGVAGKYNLECPSDLPLDLRQYDRIAFPNQGRMARYLDAGLVRQEQAVLVGFPKLDRLVNARISARDAASRLGLPPDRPTAIYAPTFSPESSLQRHGEDIVRQLIDGGFNVIVKLHDRSLDPDPRYSGGRDWRSIFGRLAATGRCLLAQYADTTDYLLAADVMVTDHSTIGFEFCAIDRPLVVFDVPELLSGARIDAGKVRLLRNAADVVTRADQVPIVARAALDAPEARADSRATAAREAFHDPGGATARAVAICHELLEAPGHAGKRLRAAAG